MLKRLGFKLADALGRDAVLTRQFVQRRLVVGQPATLDDVARAAVELARNSGDTILN
jgi:hypothetical protein